MVASLLQLSSESVFSTIFPADCRICGAPLLNISRLPVCADCLNKIQASHHAQCRICGELLVSPHVAAGAAVAPDVTQDNGPVCGNCQKSPPAFVAAMAYGPHSGTLRELVHLLKYQRVRSAASVLGKHLAPVLAQILPQTGPAVVAPVPLHRSRLRHRGFNQAELIAKIALKCSAPRSQGLEFNRRALVRSRATLTQTGLTHNQRRENVRGAFTVRYPQDVAGRRVILVDDVFTTGATVGECARVLLRAGAEGVWVATVVRVSHLFASSSGMGNPIEQEPEWEDGAFSSGTAFAAADGQS